MDCEVNNEVRVLWLYPGPQPPSSPNFLVPPVTPSSPSDLDTPTLTSVLPDLVVGPSLSTVWTARG